MSSPEEQLEEIRKELQWVNVKDSFNEENKSNMPSFYKILVPTGVLATTGVLGTGFYYMLKKNSRKQQLFMRYRVFAQGITVAIAAFGILQIKLSS